jgi:hypothetical protein
MSKIPNYLVVQQNKDYLITEVDQHAYYIRQPFKLIHCLYKYSYLTSISSL